MRFEEARSADAEYISLQSSFACEAEQPFLVHAPRPVRYISFSRNNNSYSDWDVRVLRRDRIFSSYLGSARPPRGPERPESQSDGRLWRGPR